MKSTVMIKKNSEFTTVIKKGKWFSGDDMTLYVLKTSNHNDLEETKKNQLGIGVSKKFSKSSVKRNRVKRLIKEAYRLNESSIMKGYSLVILWKNNVDYDKMTWEEVNADLCKCFRKAVLWNEKIEEENNA